MKLVACGALVSICLFGQQAQGPLTDQRISDLVTAGVSSPEVIRIIASAPEIEFDLRPEATAGLMKAGVSVEIIKAMAARENGGTVITTSDQRISTANTNTAIPVSRTPQKAHLTVTALANRVVTHENSFIINIPGSVDTSCYGSGSAWSYTRINCSSIVTPPTEIPANISWVDVYQQVIANGLVYTLKCTAHWIGSACGTLADNGAFPAEIDGKVMRVEVHRGGNMGKLLHSKFQILDISPANQVPAAQTIQSGFPIFLTPAGWVRKDFIQYSTVAPSANDSGFIIAVYHDTGGGRDAFALLSTALAIAIERAHATVLSQTDAVLGKTASGYDAAVKQLTVNVAGVPPYWFVAAIPGIHTFSFVLCAAPTHEILAARIPEIDSVLDSLRLEPNK